MLGGSLGWGVGSLLGPKVIGIKDCWDSIIPFSGLYKVNFSAKLADNILYRA